MLATKPQYVYNTRALFVKRRLFGAACIRNAAYNGQLYAVCVGQTSAIRLWVRIVATRAIDLGIPQSFTHRRGAYTMSCKWTVSSHCNIRNLAIRGETAPIYTAAKRHLPSYLACTPKWVLRHAVYIGAQPARWL